MSIEVRTRVKFKNWNVPNFAVLDNRTDGDDRENHTIPIMELDADAMAALAEAWLADLYGKSDFPNPFVKK